MGTFNVLGFFSLIYHGLKVSQSFDCNFDDGICDWKQDTSDNFNWTRHRGRTLSEYTGPESDHTTTNGFYIYIETSLPRQSGDIARLISPLKEPGSYCLTFWYSLYGRTIHSLNVYTRTDSSNETLIFSKKENATSAEWRKGAVSMSAEIKYKVVLEGIVGGVKGDIAVDDISLTNGMCSVDCDFDSDLCWWTQENIDNFDWERQTGRTPTLDTGPVADHTTGGGSYIYIETSYPRKQGDKAKLISSGQGPGLYCLTFWYIMYGRHVNRLSVYLIHAVGNGTQLLSKENEENYTDWKEAMLSFHSTVDYQIVLEGVCGNGSEGDIAVDDISMSVGRCTMDLTSTTQSPHSSEGPNSETRYDAMGNATSKVEQTQHTMMKSSATTVETLFSKYYTPKFDTSVMTTAQHTALAMTTHMSKTVSTIMTSLAEVTVNHTASSTHTLLTENIRSSPHTHVKQLTTLTSQTKIQEQSPSSVVITTKKMVQTTQLITSTSLSTFNGVTSTETTSYSSDKKATVNKDTNSKVTSRETSPSSRKDISLSALPSTVLTRTTSTITQTQNTPSEMRESSLMTIYISFTTITVTLVVLVIVLSVLVCRLGCQEMIRISKMSRSVQTSVDTDPAVVNPSYIGSTSEDETDLKRHTGTIQLSRDQYTEVSLDTMQLKDTTDNEYSATSLKTERVRSERHAYNHIKNQRHPIIDKTYSRISEIQGNRTMFSKPAVTKNSNAGKTITEANAIESSSMCGRTYNSFRKTQSGTPTVNQDDGDDDLDIVYDHIVAGGKPKKTNEADEYSHLTQLISKENRNDQNHGYPTISKKKDNTCVLFECEEKKEKGFVRRSLVQPDQSEWDTTCQNFVSRDVSKYSVCEDDNNHDYFILEKIDDCNKTNCKI